VFLRGKSNSRGLRVLRGKSNVVTFVARRNVVIFVCASWQIERRDLRVLRGKSNVVTFVANRNVVIFVCFVANPMS
jgi:hypothetical protein